MESRLRIAIPILAIPLLALTGCADVSGHPPDESAAGAPDGDTTPDDPDTPSDPDPDTSPPEDPSTTGSFCDSKITEHGLPVLFEDDFEYEFDGAAGGAPAPWDGGRSDANVSVVDSPLMGSRALLGRQPVGASGTGTYHFEKDLGQDLTEAVFCFTLGFEPNYPQNGTSEKILHFNLYGGASYYLFQYHLNIDASVMGISPDPADDYSGGFYAALPPNLTERHSNGRLWVSPQRLEEPVPNTSCT